MCLGIWFPIPVLGGGLAQKVKINDSNDLKDDGKGGKLGPMRDV